VTRKLALAALAAAAALGCRRARPPAGACLAFDAPDAPIGFDASFSVVARATCADLPHGRIAWRQVAGPPLRALSVDADGFRLHARTPALADARPGPIPWGVVPFSPRTRGEVTLEARWTDGGGREIVRQLHVAAAPRARGLPNTPVGVRVYLGQHDNDGWHLVDRPAGSAAALDARAGLAALVPDVTGDYRLGDAGGRELVLRAARYDETPLDCGRSGCHPAVTDDAARSPMTTVLARGLAPGPAGAGPAFGPGYPGCALACHATAEPGLPDGGYVHVAGELGVAADAARRWEELPRPLRRAGGVGCLACHGPAALPPPSARWTLLRSDVCAICHDAPPTYGHVAAWLGTAMARADRDARARADRACARCHTTAGFLASVAGATADRRPPADAAPVGIACAACHAVHARETGAPPGSLLRAPATPALLAGAGAGPAVCLPCHTPDPDAPRPSASAAAIWLGRGGLDPATGAPLTGAPIHAGVAGGCVGCHRGGPDGLARGAGHGFGAAREGCAGCHAQPLPPPGSELTARARQLWDDWRRAAGTPATAPAHASDARVDRATPLGRAAWDVLLVLEDPAADAHNPRYARALLAAAEAAIAGGRAR
jgi:hypothetical protein